MIIELVGLPGSGKTFLAEKSKIGDDKLGEGKSMREMSLIRSEPSVTNRLIKRLKLLFWGTILTVRFGLFFDAEADFVSCVRRIFLYMVGFVKLANAEIFHPNNLTILDEGPVVWIAATQRSLSRIDKKVIARFYSQFDRISFVQVNSSWDIIAARRLKRLKTPGVARNIIKNCDRKRLELFESEKELLSSLGLVWIEVENDG